MTFRRSVEIRVRREEFTRLLRANVGDVRIDGDTIEWLGAHAQATMRLTRLPEDDDAGGPAPRHLVEIVLDAACEAEAEAFMDRFDRAFLPNRG